MVLGPARAVGRSTHLPPAVPPMTRTFGLRGHYVVLHVSGVPVRFVSREAVGHKAELHPRSSRSQGILGRPDADRSIHHVTCLPHGANPR